MCAHVSETFLLVLIEEATIYLLVAVDKYGHEYEVLLREKNFVSSPYDLRLIRIQTCVREPNGAGSLKHQAIDT